MDGKSFWEANKILVISDGSKPAIKMAVDHLRGINKQLYVLEEPPDKLDIQNESFDAAVISMPGRTEEAVSACIDAGVKRIWIHWRTDTPEAVRLCKEADVEYVAGKCPMIYLAPPGSFHGLHVLFVKMMGKY